MLNILMYRQKDSNETSPYAVMEMMLVFSLERT